MDYRAVSSAIHSNFDNLTLNFIEKDNANQQYTVVMKYKSIRLINIERFVIFGNINISDKGFNDGYIEFNFITQTFYRVKYSASGSIRRIYKLIINPIHADGITSLLSFIANFLNAENN